MKQRAFFSLSFTLTVICLLALLAVSAPAQDQESQDAKKKAAEEVMVKVREMMVKVVGEKIGFETKVTKGAPYSATAEAETIQTLADGNRIRSKSTTLVYRDSEGRMRREVVGKGQSVPTEIFINDPATGVNYSLDAQEHVAHKSQVRLTDLDLDKMKLMKELEMKRQTQERLQAEQGDKPRKKKRAPVTESLGQQMIEGALCEGSRTTSIIPAEEVGNELPITIVNEQWYSPELQVYVLTRQSDPRAGETIYRLTNINRGEPDRSLFEVPAGYNLRDDSALPAKILKRRPEEER